MANLEKMAPTNENIPARDIEREVNPPIEAENSETVSREESFASSSNLMFPEDDMIEDGLKSADPDEQATARALADPISSSTQEISLYKLGEEYLELIEATGVSPCVSVAKSNDLKNLLK